MRINPSITANYFLKKGKKEEIPISVMKLLKLTYIAHGWTLAVSEDDEGILDGERVEAWKHGPVIPSLYHEFKHFRNSPILEWSESTIAESDEGFNSEPIFIEKADIQDRENLMHIFHSVWEAYKEYSAWGLSRVTHEYGSPWAETKQKEETFIPNELIKSFYQNFLRNLANDNIS